MVFTPTSTNQRWRRQSGATLVEVMIGLMLGVILSLAVVSFTIYSGKSLAGLFNYVDMQYSSRQALDIMSRDIRQAVSLQAFATNQITLQKADGQPLVFTYSPADETLMRIDGTNNTVLLTQCDRLEFSIYKRTPTIGTLVREVSVNPASAKVINISWHCYRPIIGARLTTDEVESAKIIIRN